MSTRTPPKMLTADELLQPINQPTRPEWGRLAPRRALAAFLQRSKLRADAIGGFCRGAIVDHTFPTSDPTRVLRYLATRGATSEVLATARATIKEYRAWEREGFEIELHEVERVNPERALAIRESLHESRKIVERLYAEDAQA